MTPPMMDLIWTLAGFILTLMVFSYILGDNPLFRLASYLLIGSAAGYLFTLLVYQIILQRLILPLFNINLNGDWVSITLAILPVVLSLMLALKLFPGGISMVGNIPMAYLVGVGAAVMIVGTVTGTLFGQVQGAVNAFGTNNIGEAFILLGGTISTLAYFHYGTHSTLGGQQSLNRRPWIEWLAWAGKIFIGITLGAIFAGVYLAALSALISRLDFLRFVVENLVIKIGM